MVETSDEGGDVIELACWGGEVADDDVAGVVASLACCICLKKGFLEPESVEEATGIEGTAGALIWDVGAGVAWGDDTEGSERCELVSLERIWLLVGVVSCGVAS